MKLFFRTLFTVISQPKTFFSTAYKDVLEWKHVLRYLVIFTFIAGIFTTINVTDLWSRIVSLPELSVLGELPTLDIGLFGLFILYVVFVFLLLGLTALKYYLAHFFLKLYNKKIKLKETYALLTYGGTHGWVAMPLFFVGGLFLFVGSWWTVLSILLILCALGLEGYTMYLRITALARKHNISVINVFLSVYVWSLSIYMIIMTLVLFIVVFGVMSVLLLLGKI